MVVLSQGEKKIHYKNQGDFSWNSDESDIHLSENLNTNKVSNLLSLMWQELSFW